jgi:hypothetical protein
LDGTLPSNTAILPTLVEIPPGIGGRWANVNHVAPAAKEAEAVEGFVIGDGW